jgi:predicted transcriptional regulator
VAALDQELLLELDRHPRSTAEELSGHLDGEPPAAVRTWLRMHEGWLVERDAMRWRLSTQGERFLAALD